MYDLISRREWIIDDDFLDDETKLSADGQGYLTELVRCKDCKYQFKAWHKDNRFANGGYYMVGCMRNGDPFVSHTVNGHDTDYCSYGERAEA